MCGTIIIIGEIEMDRSNERLWKLVGTPPDTKPKRRRKSKKSIEDALEYYRTKFEGSKTKSVRNRIARLTEALDILVDNEMEKLEC